MSKKLLSMVLVIAMVLSLMPMSFAVEGEETLGESGVTVEYDIMSHYVANKSIANILTLENTNGFFAFEGTSAGTTLWYHTSKCVQLTTTDQWLIFKINVPVAGMYDIQIKNYLGKSGGTLNAYIFQTDETPDETALSDSNYIGSVNCSSYSGGNNGATSGTPNPFEDEDGNPASYTFQDAGEYYIGFDVTAIGDKESGFVGNIVLDGGEGNALIGDMTLSSDSVVAGETATASATAYKSNDGSLATLTYTSSDETVATVDSEGNITTLKAGKTIISATAEDAVNSLSCELEVTAAKSGITVEYDIMSHYATGKSIANLLTYDTTNGFFGFEATSPNTTVWYHNNDKSKCVQLYAGAWLIFKINVPVAGMYDIQIKNYLGNSGGTLNAYIFPDTGGTPDETALSSDNYIGSVNCSSYSGGNNGATSGTPNSFKDEDGNSASYTFPTAGEYYIGFDVTAIGTNGTSGFIGDIVLAGGEGNALMPYFDGNSTLEIGDTATLSGFLSSTAAEATVSYESSNDCVTVDADGTITAEKTGKATVTMTATDDATVISSANTYTVDITVPNAKTDFVSVGIDNDGDGYATITSATLGADVTVTAADRSGYVFRGWVRGSADNGHLVSTEETYEFTATTHTYLTAIYTKEVEGETNEYYHWNGQFLGNDQTTAEANLSPIVGYTFARTWTEAKTENSITSLIADFNKNSTEYEITGDGTFSITEHDSKYDTEVTCTSNSGEVYWYRDGKLVDYGTEYKFFIWDSTTIKTSNEGHNGAKLMLDENVKDNTYMVEYDAGNATLLEVGILFGDTGDTPTVDSCKEKMSSQRNINEKGHGQFSATADEYTVARGYLIYKDGDSYRVIYAN